MPERNKQILIVAGEASADRYGAALARQLQTLRGEDTLRFWGAGGDAMRQAGVELLAHVRDLGQIGPREVISGLRAYYNVFRRIVNRVEKEPPDVAVLLDFPDFNLRLAKKIKRRNVKVVYYISPQVWAWRGGRVRAIRKYVDKMLVILPFEEAYYRERGVDAAFVGHPLLEDFHPVADRRRFLESLELNPEQKTVALLAGSRRKEIEYILPVMLSSARLLANRVPVQFLISAAPTVDLKQIQRIAQANLGAEDMNLFRIVTQNSRDILANVDFAFVKSGTSALEAALVGVPFLITYKISALSWRVGSLLIRAPFKGLPNLLAGKRVVPELFQYEATPEALAQTAWDYLEYPEKCATMRTELGKIRNQLSAICASKAVAAVISGYL